MERGAKGCVRACVCVLRLLGDCTACSGDCTALLVLGLPEPGYACTRWLPSLELDLGVLLALELGVELLHVPRGRVGLEANVLEPFAHADSTALVTLLGGPALLASLASLQGLVEGVKLGFGPAEELEDVSLLLVLFGLLLVSLGLLSLVLLVPLSSRVLELFDEQVHPLVGLDDARWCLVALKAELAKGLFNPSCAPEATFPSALLGGLVGPGNLILGHSGGREGCGGGGNRLGDWVSDLILGHPGGRGVGGELEQGDG